MLNKLTYPYFEDGVTPLNGAMLNPIVKLLNDAIDEINANEPMEAETTAILARYTKNISTSQKLAFNTFIKALKTNGIYENIDVLILPFLASNIGEATKNAINGESAFATNGDLLSLTDNGISAVAGANVATFDSAQLHTPTHKDLHISFYNNNESAIDNLKVDQMFTCAGRNVVSFGKNFVAGASKLGVNYFNQSSVQVSLTTNAEGDTKTEARKFACVSFGANSTIVSYDGINSVSDVPMKDSGYLSAMRFAQFSGDTYNSLSNGGEWNTMSQFNYGLISFGKALTESQCSAFNNAVATLMNVILG